VTALAGDRRATVSFEPPAFDGGSPITGYTVTAAPGGRTCTATPQAMSCTVDGLTNGQVYTFTVAATNGVGTGEASAASNDVTPSAGVLPVTGSPTLAIAGFGTVLVLAGAALTAAVRRRKR
jgi:LPXTG-motif cell wall-anchored protein